MKYLFFVIFLFVSRVEALTVKRVNLIVVNSSEQFTDQEVRDTFEVQKMYADKSGVLLKLHKIIRIDDPSKEQTLDSRLLRLHDYIKYVRRNGLHRGSVTNIFLVPRIVEDGLKYWAGVARGVCSKSFYSVAWAAVSREKSAAGKDGMLFSFTVASHELEHLLGAYHDESGANLMSSYALYYVENKLLPLTRNSRKEVKTCIR